MRLKWGDLWHALSMAWTKLKRSSGAWNSRLAPTPSGLLHLGNILNFSLTSTLVRVSGGELSLRIDDLDTERSRPEYFEDIFATLGWLGFRWEHGPQTVEEFRAHYRQELHLARYRRHLDQIPKYLCECTRSQVRARTSAPYDGHCRRKQLHWQGGKTQWRYYATDPAQDVVLWRKDDFPSYHLASLSDDLALGVNLIVRGEDLREASEVQKLLAHHLGVAGQAFEAAILWHHPLVLDPQGEKLSKSQPQNGGQSLRQEFATPGELFRELSRRAQLPVVESLEEAREVWASVLLENEPRR